MNSEFKRQFFHIILGFVFIILFYVIGRELLAIILFAVICVDIMLIHIKIYFKMQIPYLEKMLHQFERPNTLFGKGLFWYFAGIFLAVLMFKSFQYFAVVTLLLALGDGLATIIGMYGRHKLPWNRQKTVEGSIGFIIGGMSALIILPTPLTLAIVILSAVAESLPLQVDDNIIIPLVAGTLFFVF